MQEFVTMLGQARKDWVPQGGRAPTWPQQSSDINEVSISCQLAVPAVNHTHILVICQSLDCLFAF